jgi:hypothetical protein
VSKTGLLSLVFSEPIYIMGGIDKIYGTDLVTFAIKQRDNRRVLLSADIASWDVTKLTEYELDIQIGFENPQGISSTDGTESVLLVTIDNSKGTIASLATNLPMEAYTTLEIPIPA